MSEPEIYHLKGKRFSGRGVKLRELGPDEVTDARLTAAKVAGKGASAYEIETLRRSECVRRMIVAVTEKGDLENLGGAKWVELTQQQLEEDNGKHSFSKLFTAKDANALNYLCAQRIDVGDDEIGAIEKGMLTASGD
jgi:hypothetical protein